MNREKYEKRAILDFSRKELMADFQRAANDVGSPEVQVALLQRRIALVSSHLQERKKDHNSRNHLKGFIAKRQSLLKYLHGKSKERYAALIDILSIKDRI